MESKLMKHNYWEILEKGRYCVKTEETYFFILVGITQYGIKKIENIEKRPVETYWNDIFDKEKGYGMYYADSFKWVGKAEYMIRSLDSKRSPFDYIYFFIDFIYKIIGK